MIGWFRRWWCRRYGHWICHPHLMVLNVKKMEAVFDNSEDEPTVACLRCGTRLTWSDLATASDRKKLKVTFWEWG